MGTAAMAQMCKGRREVRRRPLSALRPQHLPQCQDQLPLPFAPSDPPSPAGSPPSTHATTQCRVSTLVLATGPPHAQRRSCAPCTLMEWPLSISLALARLRPVSWAPSPSAPFAPFATRAH